MTFSSIVDLVIITQLMLIGYLKYRLQEDDCHVTYANTRDWIRPILRFQHNWQLFSDSFMPIRNACGMMGFIVEANETWFTEREIEWELAHYDIGLPHDIKGGPIEKIIDYIPELSFLVAYKAALITRGGRYIPKAFQLPHQKQEFLAYQQLPENKEKFWIQKNLQHRGNRVKDIQDMEFDSDSLVQEYIANPFIIDDRRFSIAVFVAFTSINPVRAYVLDSDVLLRFCAKGYYPLDFTDISTYITDGVNEFGVVMCDELESLKHMSLENHYSHKRTLDAYIRSEGKNPDALYSQIYDAIRDVMNSSGAIATNISGKPRTKYYEITRWDFVLDENLNVYLIEVNHQPNMPAQHYPSSNQWLHFNYCAIYNMFRVTALLDVHGLQFGRSSYIVRDSDVLIHNRICHTSCLSCNAQECLLCSQCLLSRQRNLLKEVFLEHLNRGDMRLVLNFAEDDILNFERIKELDETPWFEYNALLALWFREKCTADMYWCVQFRPIN